MSLRSVALAAVLALGLGGVASAQAPMPKNFETIDGNGVTLTPGGYEIRIPEPSVSIGDPKNGGLTYQRYQLAVSYSNGPASDASSQDLSPAYFRNNNLYGQALLCGDILPQYSVSLGQESESLVPSGPPPFTYASDQYSGSSISFSGGLFTYNRSDGTVLVYESVGVYTFCTNGTAGRIKTMTKPDGEVITWNYYMMPSGAYQGNWRLQSVTNNLGYQIHFQYERDTATTNAEYGQWQRIQKVTAIDNAINACGATALSCNDSAGADWPYLVYGYANDGTYGTGSVQTVTDRLGNVSKFQYSGNIQSTTTSAIHLLGYASPASSSWDITLSFSPFRVYNAGGTWTYGYNGSGGSTITNSDSGYSRTVTWSTSQPTPNNILNMTAQMPETDTVNGRTTTYAYQFDSYWSGVRLTRVTNPDGDYTEYTYDFRRNVTQVRDVAKSGSSLADIYTYASYPESGSVVCSNTKTCNKPLWVTVPGPFSGTPSSLPKTDYMFDSSHGGLLTETKPAPGTGALAAIRPETRYTYNATGGVTRVATVKSCRTTSSCAGTADELVIETNYNSKRLPSSVTTRAGNNTTPFTPTYSTFSNTYTPQGDIESVDGPLSGAADTVWNFYGVTRQLRATVGPDPDGAGSLVYRATRTTFDGDGKPIMVEQGSVPSPSSCSAANSFCSATMTVLAKTTSEYDVYGRNVRWNMINLSTGNPESVTQTSYDVAGRVACVAKRMNPAVYSSLPNAALLQPITNPTTGACAQSTAGSFGQDQIINATYNADNDLTVIKSGYGSGLVRNERTVIYFAKGQASTVADAKGNLTTYEYDGFNRPAKTRYPKPGSGTTSANTACNWSTEDFCDALTYDGSGRVLTERRRDGQTITNSYDNLSRLTLIDRPSGELDVTNDYDNFNNLTSASQTGASVTWTYDVLGRMLTEVQPNGTVTSAWDTAGRRTQLTYPGNVYYTNYDYYDDGRLKLIGLNGATTGSNVLATYYDDQLGRRVYVCRGPNNSTNCDSGGFVGTGIAYDNVSRVSTVAHSVPSLSGTPLYWVNFLYSPANQLVQRQSYSPSFNWAYAASFSEAYTVNGLNQYTAIGGGSLAYDYRGNTTNDTTKTYTYDSSNRLTSSSNGTTLTYDPTGRLLSVVQGSTTTKFLYDGTRLIAEYNGSGTLVGSYVHGDGVDDPIVWFESSGTSSKKNLLKDERGSVISSNDGTTTTYKQYDEYGTPSGTYGGRFQYTGQTWIPELQLYYYKARFYSPDLGRFMQTDPIGMKDQVNLYAYVGDDPMNRVDPTGTTCTTSGEGDAMRATACKIDEGRDKLIDKLGIDAVNRLEKGYKDAVNKLLAKGDKSVDVRFKVRTADGEIRTRTAYGKASDVASNLIKRTVSVDFAAKDKGIAQTILSQNRMVLYANNQNFQELAKGFDVFNPDSWLRNNDAGIEKMWTHEGMHYPKIHQQLDAQVLDWNRWHNSPFNEGAERALNW